MHNSRSGNFFIRYMLFMAFFLNSFVLFAQMGKNGALTTSTTSILNDYTPLTANATAGTKIGRAHV